MADERTKEGPLSRWRQRRRRKREQKGGSPEKPAERRIPTADPTDLVMRLGDVERESRFTKE